MRKRRKTTPITKLQRECENLWKVCCVARDGLRCMVKYHYPHAPLKHTNIFQVDHCFTRTNKHLFLDIRNGTTVCSACNSQKNWDKKSVGRLIDEIVAQREGINEFAMMKACDLRGKPNLDWHNYAWLEKKKIELTLKWADFKEKKRT